MTIPTHLRSILHHLVARNLADMTAQVHFLVSVYGHDHPHVQIARKHKALAQELAELVGLREREAA